MKIKNKSRFLAVSMFSMVFFNCFENNVSVPTDSIEQKENKEIAENMENHVKLMDDYSDSIMNARLSPDEIKESEALMNLPQNESYLGKLSSTNNWVELPGRARDIDVSKDGSIRWVISTSTTSGGYKLYYWSGNNWKRAAGGGVKVAVTDDGYAWVVNSYGNLYVWKSGGWTRVKGVSNVTDVGAGTSKWKAWVIADDWNSSSKALYKFNGGTSWSDLEAGGHGVFESVSVENNRPYAMDSHGSVFRWYSSQWQEYNVYPVIWVDDLSVSGSEILVADDRTGQIMAILFPLPGVSTVIPIQQALIPLMILYGLQIPQNLDLQ